MKAKNLNYHCFLSYYRSLLITMAINNNRPCTRHKTARAEKHSSPFPIFLVYRTRKQTTDKKRNKDFRIPSNQEKCGRKEYDEQNRSSGVERAKHLQI